MTSKVSIVIINWNGSKDTLRCLESLSHTHYPNYDVVLVDNNSTDGSVHEILNFCERSQIGLKIFEYSGKNQKLNMVHPHGNIKFQQEGNSSTLKKLVLIKNNKNYGFAEGNNIGIRYVLKNLDPTYVLLLNNDTIVKKNFLDVLVKTADRSDKEVGSFQSLLLNEDGTKIDSAGQDPFLWGVEEKGMGSRYEKVEDMEIFGPCAAAALYKTHALQEAGLFDEDFFIMLEDLDLSWRLNIKGFKSILVSQSIVYHKRGISDPLSIKEIVFGPKTRNVLPWYHGSKNWLIIVFRYYSLKLVFIALVKYPHKVFFTFYRFIYASLKMEKTQEGLKIILKNLKVRKEIKNDKSDDYYLGKLQKGWIKRYQ